MEEREGPEEPEGSGRAVSTGSTVTCRVPSGSAIRRSAVSDSRIHCWHGPSTDRSRRSLVNATAVRVPYGVRHNRSTVPAGPGLTGTYSDRVAVAAGAVVADGGKSRKGRAGTPPGAAGAAGPGEVAGEGAGEVADIEAPAAGCGSLSCMGPR